MSIDALDLSALALDAATILDDDDLAPAPNNPSEINTNTSSAANLQTADSAIGGVATGTILAIERPSVMSGGLFTPFKRRSVNNSGPVPSTPVAITMGVVVGSSNGA